MFCLSANPSKNRTNKINGFTIRYIHCNAVTTKLEVKFFKKDRISFTNLFYFVPSIVIVKVYFLSVRQSYSNPASLFVLGIILTPFFSIHFLQLRHSFLYESVLVVAHGLRRQVQTPPESSRCFHDRTESS